MASFNSASFPDSLALAKVRGISNAEHQMGDQKNTSPLPLSFGRSVEAGFSHECAVGLGRCPYLGPCRSAHSKQTGLGCTKCGFTKCGCTKHSQFQARAMDTQSAQFLKRAMGAKHAAL